MHRLTSSFASAAFLLAAPGTVAGLIPWWLTRWQRGGALWLDGTLPRVTGGLLVVAGLISIVDSFARFALQGRGTPAPVLPTQRLVVSGQYRFVRNPMYLAVLALIVGQGLMLGQTQLLLYGAGMWLVFHLFVVIYEEPTLRRQFAQDYDGYARRVRRWWPLPTSSG